MKKFFVAAVMVTVITALTGCISIDVNGRGIRGRSVRANGNIITYTLDNPAEFTKIVASSIIDVDYSQSTDGTTSVSITCSENLRDFIDVSLKNGTLHVGTVGNSMVRNDYTLKVRASSSSLDEVKTSSTADVSVEGRLATDNLKLAVTSTGDIEVDELTCDVLEVSTSSTGDVEIDRGTVNRAFYTVASTGDIDAKGVKARMVEAKSSSVGDIECYASESLRARASSTGDIYYYGRPASVEKTESSIGDIVAR